MVASSVVLLLASSAFAFFFPRVAGGGSGASLGSITITEDLQSVGARIRALFTCLACPHHVHTDLLSISVRLLSREFSVCFGTRA